MHLRSTRLFRTTFLSGSCSTRSKHTMNRPRNRQPRNTTRNTNDNRRYDRDRVPSGSVSVPTTQQVQAGAFVSIVLKADQRSGREVQGVVQDLLTRGNHPRGIKVRLQDGRIGRVQRMVTGDSGSIGIPASTYTLSPLSQPAARRPEDHRQATSSEATPIADVSNAPQVSQDSDDLTSSFHKKLSLNQTTIQCPICGDFEGDEAAVSHHVQKHLD